MGLGINKLYATNIGDNDKILLSGWIPVKKHDGYYSPDETPVGFDIFVPNVLNLTEEQGTLCVEIIESQEETGIWLICQLLLN